jgi:hypothetical protein
VQQVDALRPFDVSQDTVGELVDDLGQCVLVERWRSGVDMHDAEAGFDVGDRRQVSGGATGVDDAVDPRLGERGDELAHVDVHAAPVARPGLGERGRVEREDPETAHQCAQRPITAVDSSRLANGEGCRPTPRRCGSGG